MENTSPTIEEGKTIAIIAYITIIGLIVAIVMNNDKKNSFAAYHIRQSLGIIVLSLGVWIVYLIVTLLLYIPFISTLLYLALLVFWVLGLITAVQGQKKPLPLVGEQFQKWFRGVG
jgi:uncharacterized membrane protein